MALKIRKRITNWKIVNLYDSHDLRIFIDDELDPCGDKIVSIHLSHEQARVTLLALNEYQRFYASMSDALFIELLEFTNDLERIKFGRSVFNKNDVILDHLILYLKNADISDAMKILQSTEVLRGLKLHGTKEEY